MLSRQLCLRGTVHTLRTQQTGQYAVNSGPSAACWSGGFGNTREVHVSVDSFDPQQFDPVQASAQLEDAVVLKVLAVAQAQIDEAELRLLQRELRSNQSRVLAHLDKALETYLHAGVARGAILGVQRLQRRPN